MAEEEEETPKEPPPPPVNITVYMGAIPPPKKPRMKRASQLVLTAMKLEHEAAEQAGEGENGETKEGEEAAPAAPEETQPPPEPEPEEPPPPPPPPEPRKMLLNCNVPVLILLHHARKCYLRDEPHAAEQLGLELSGPPTMFDLATLEGKVADLASKAEIETRAADLVEPRAEYVLVLRTPGEEEDTFKYTPLCEKHKGLECAV